MCVLGFIQFARVLRKIQETVVIGFIEDYPFWFAVDFVKRFVFVAVIMYEKDSEVRTRTSTSTNTRACMLMSHTCTHTHTYMCTQVHTHNAHTHKTHTHTHIVSLCVLFLFAIPVIYSSHLTFPLLLPCPSPCPPCPPLPLPIPQAIAIFVITLYFCLYSYLRPYKTFTDNIFELLLLANLFALMLLRSVVYVRDVLSDIAVSPDPNDCSEWKVVRPSYFAIVLGILYYLPVIYTALPITAAVLRYAH